LLPLMKLKLKKRAGELLILSTIADFHTTGVTSVETVVAWRLHGFIRYYSWSRHLF